jgi:hypothetical protein
MISSVKGLKPVVSTSMTAAVPYLTFVTASLDFGASGSSSGWLLL